jgi:hypothetical protein
MPALKAGDDWGNSAPEQLCNPHRFDERELGSAPGSITPEPSLPGVEHLGWDAKPVQGNSEKRGSDQFTGGQCAV